MAKIHYSPLIIRSLNLEHNNKLSNLEMFFLVTQEFIQDRIKKGKKGKKLSSNDKITYETMQGILYTLYSEMAVEGCFSFGICETCSDFNNLGHDPETFGTCKGKTVSCFDTCSEHSAQGGGFGL